MSLLDGSHVYLAPPEDKTGTFEREGKSMGFSQRAIQQGRSGGFKSWGRGRRGSWQGKDWASVTGPASQERQSTKKVTLVQLLLCQPSRGLLTALFKWNWRKAMMKLSSVTLTAIRACGILTAHKMLLREPISLISKKIVVDQMVDSVTDDSTVTCFMSFQNGEGLA